MEVPCTKVQSRLGGIPCEETFYYCNSLANPGSHADDVTGNALAAHVQEGRPLRTIFGF